MPHKRDVFDLAVVEEFPDVPCEAGNSVAVTGPLRLSMRAEIEREAVKFTRETLKLCPEAGGGLRPARQNNQSWSHTGFEVVQTNSVLSLEVS
jgi:hypothetical protein